MIKIFRKNQLIFGTLGLILITAGYLNYTYNPELKYQYELTGNIDDTLGETIYVNALPEEQNIYNPSSNSGTSNKEEPILQKNDIYFNEIKMQRDKMFDEQIESYTKILENSSILTEQKDNAQNEIKNINKLKSSILIAEELILLKNVQNVAIITNGKSINVIIGNDAELQSDIVAQIYAIITRELETNIGNIQIMLKKN